MKCAKISNARAEPLFCSLNLLFGDVLVAVVVVVCLSSLITHYRLFWQHDIELGIKVKKQNCTALRGEVFLFKNIFFPESLYHVLK